MLRHSMMRSTLIWTGILLSTYSVLLSAPVLAQVPPLVRYQGQAVDTKGVPLEGPYTLTFRLYDAETAGAKVWEEIQPNVPLARGYFSVLLGSVKPLTVMDWSKPCWLSVQVNAEPELAPRQQITSVPLAIRAETAEIVKTSGITDDTNRLVPSGAIMLWTGTACPASYTRVSALDGKFVVGGATYNSVAGGSNTHAHGTGTYAGPSHTHTVPIDGYGGAAVGFAGRISTGAEAAEHNLKTATTTPDSGSGGTGAVTGTSASADSRPEFATVLLCQKD